ncbi:alpha/beta fold hydrolase [Spelaeicoccus albus]|nr:alpha/beta hydrolase [Spelaeicoccus albus]
MEIVLVPGLWLDGSTWDAVAAVLERAGHTVRPLTLPGMESKDVDRSGVTLADQVAAVVTALDQAEGPVLLVGHSAGCGISHAAVDARPDTVARAVYIGGFPTPGDAPLLDGLPAEYGEVAMPDWAEVGEEANVVDFDGPTLARFYAAAIPAPERVLTDPQRLSNDRRYDIPVTLVCPEYTSDDVRQWVAAGAEPVSELTRMHDVTYVDLPGGHWPQITQPGKLARVILDAAASAAGLSTDGVRAHGPDGG